MVKIAPRGERYDGATEWTNVYVGNRYGLHDSEQAFAEEDR